MFAARSSSHRPCDAVFVPVDSGDVRFGVPGDVDILSSVSCAGNIELAQKSERDEALGLAY